MSSSSTTWTTDTNTKSGTVQIYSSNVSVLKILGSEAGDAILELFADEGDDNADKWRLWVNDADDDLHFANYTSGSWADLLTIQDGGNVGIGTDAPTDLLTVASTGQGQLSIISDTGDSGADLDAVLLFRENAANTTRAHVRWDHALDALTMGVDSDADITILGSGNVGIGVTDPDGVLEVVQTATSGYGVHVSRDLASGSTDQHLVFIDQTNTGDDKNALVVNNDGGGDIATFNNDATEIMVIGYAGAGNVGIGTSTPSAILTVSGVADSSVAGFRLVRDYSSIGNNDVLGRIEFAGTLDDHANDYVGAKITAASVETWVGSTQHGTQLRFHVTPEDGTLNSTASMVIHDDGNVGIGETAPATLLHINKQATTGAIPLRLLTLEIAEDSDVNTVIGEGPSISFMVAETGGSEESGLLAVVRESATDGETDASMTFWTGANDSAVTEKMRITSTGFVGIGTADPDSKLHIVDSTISATEAVCHLDCTESSADDTDIMLWLDWSADANIHVSSVRAITLHDSGGEIGYWTTAENGVVNTAFTNVSDIRIKKDIVDTSLEGLNIVNKIKIRDFKWNDKRKYVEGMQVIGGFVADELYEVYPHATDGTPGAVKDDGTIDAMGVTEGNLISVMLKSIQELSAKVTALENA